MNAARLGRRRFVALAAAAAPWSLALGPVRAQAGPASTATDAWPTRPVRLLVGFPGGSTPDMVARTLAEPLTQALGQPVIVDHQPGASGNIAAAAVARASDGHTLGVLINGNLTSARTLNPRLPFEPARDFSLLSLLTTAPLVLVAPAALPDGAAFLAEARRQGDRWNYGSVGAGSVAHLGMEWLKTRVPGLNARHIPYNGNPAVVTALLGGQIQLALMPPGVALPQIKAGKLHAIGLTSSGRSALVPELPPLSQLGVTDFNLEVWTALVGPAQLPATAQRRIGAALGDILRRPEVRQRLAQQGWQAVGTSAEGLRNRVRHETALLDAIIQARGISLDLS